jgi:hypothetical protein
MGTKKNCGFCEFSDRDGNHHRYALWSIVALKRQEVVYVRSSAFRQPAKAETTTVRASWKFHLPRSGVGEKTPLPSNGNDRKRGAQEDVSEHVLVITCL